MNSPESVSPVPGMSLTLKNLYRLLTQTDVPVYSLPVLPAKARKNLTLVSFWTENLIYDFRSGTYGKMVWRTEGSQNRYLSHICNRTGIDFYDRYFAEWQPMVDAAHLQEQTEQFAAFLARHTYDREIYRARCLALPDALAVGDPLVSLAIRDGLKKLFSVSFQAMPAPEEEAAAFGDACVFAILTLLALAGTELPSLAAQLMADPALQPAAMWKNRNAAQQAPDEVKILSVGGTELRSSPLPVSSFFGREEELYDLLEAVREKRKILLTGMGGIGKTELLRQLLQAVLQEKTVESLVTVPFHDSLAGSVAMACPQPGYTAEEILHSTVVRLNRVESGRTLFLIDNVDSSALSPDDADLLLALKGAVILSSRDKEVRGFETVTLGPVSARAGELIFRSVFSAPMSAQERGELQGILQAEHMRHTLLLRTLALTARTRHLSARQAFALLPAGEGGERELAALSESRIFRQLYRESALSADAKTVVRLLAILPYLSYTEEELLTWFSQVLPPAEALHPALTQLSESGWLESDAEGWAMHPVIAASLRKKSYSEAELQPVLDTLTKGHSIEDDPLNQNNVLDSREKYIARTVFRWAGRSSKEFIKEEISMSARIFFPAYRQAEVLEVFYHKICRCPDGDDSLLMLLCIWSDQMKLPDEIMNVFFKTAERNRPCSGNVLFAAFEIELAGSCILNQHLREAKQLIEQIDTTLLPITYQLSILEVEWELYCQTMDSHLLEMLSDGIAGLSPDSLDEAEWIAYYSLKINVLLYKGDYSVFDLVPELREKRKTCRPGYHRMLLEQCLGHLLFNLQQYEEAGALMVNVWNYLEEYGRGGIEGVNIRRNIALCLQKTGRLEEAAKIYEELLANEEYESCVTDWKILQQNYAMLLIDMNRASEALPVLEGLLGYCEAVNGPAAMHANILRSLAICCKALKKRKAAREYLRRALPEIRACYGPENPRTLELEQMATDLGMEPPMPASGSETETV